MAYATHFKAHRTAASLLKKGLFPAVSGALGGLNSKLHAVCDGHGRPLVMLLSEGQLSDHKRAALMLNALPPERPPFVGNKGYDSNGFPGAGRARHRALRSSRRNRIQPIPYNKPLYCQRYRIGNMFGRIKDWRRIAMRYD